MGKKHLKRLNAPDSWNILVKDNTFVVRPHPGAHPFTEGMALVTLLKEVLGSINTTREAKHALVAGSILVDGVARKDTKFNVGFMDSVSLTPMNQHFRITLNTKGRLQPVTIDQKETSSKIGKVARKNMCRGKIQLSLSDGRTLLVDKTEAKVGDSVVITVPENAITQTLTLEKGATVLLTGGKHVGVVAKITEIEKDIITCSAGKDSFQTAKKYAFVVGKTKPVLTITKTQ